MKNYLILTECFVNGKKYRKASMEDAPASIIGYELYNEIRGFEKTYTLCSQKVVDIAILSNKDAKTQYHILNNTYDVCDDSYGEIGTNNGNTYFYDRHGRHALTKDCNGQYFASEEIA